MTDKTLPKGWHWGIGEIAGKAKTYWFYTNLRFHYQGQLYTDPGQPWTVHFYEEKGLRDDGSLRVSEYPCERGQFETEEEALEFAREKATELFNQ